MARGSSFSQKNRKEFQKILQTSSSMTEACKRAGISRDTGYRWKRILESQPQSGYERNLRSELESDQQGSALPEDLLCPEARRALTDFEYFRHRYFGRRSTPWQIEAGIRIVEMLESPDDEHLVLNCPPGSGKSTLFPHDIVIWCIVRNRRIRILIGSVTMELAETYSDAVREVLGNTFPYVADDGTVAEGILAKDYGRFKPSNGQVWRKGLFTVEQHDANYRSGKDPTVAAYGMDSKFIGRRADLVVWDDVVDDKILRNTESIDNQRNWWQSVAEARLEPGGVLVLQGQRLGPEDLYRFCLDQDDSLDENDPDYDPDSTEKTLYKHVIYKAHYEELCQNDHGKDAKAFPDGCLLDPVRLSWKKLKSKMKRDNFRCVYQQEDVDPKSVLVPAIYITGGRDPETGVEYPGCEDPDRDLWELPRGLTKPFQVIATADPSPTKFWAIQLWVYHPATQQRFLMDQIRQQMDAPDFLDYDYNGNRFVGIMEEWQLRSKDKGWPITHWIVESNAAQKFMLQYDHVQRWQRFHGVNIIAHQTHRNKSDSEYGVQTIAPHYEFGRIRIPRKQRTSARPATQQLIEEVTRWPQGRTDDCVMAHWFLEWNIPRLKQREPSPVPNQWRPSWMAA